MTDPIADMLARIRNATLARHTRVDMPSSRLKVEIAKILQSEGYIQGFNVLEPGPDRVQAQLLLEADKERAEWFTVKPDPPAVTTDAEYTCDGPAQFLVDACLGRETVNRAPLDLGVRTVAAMEAAWQSAHTGQPVRVADLVGV